MTNLFWSMLQMQFMSRNDTYTRAKYRLACAPCGGNVTGLCAASDSLQSSWKTVQQYAAVFAKKGTNHSCKVNDSGCILGGHECDRATATQALWTWLTFFHEGVADVVGAAGQQGATIAALSIFCVPCVKLVQIQGHLTLHLCRLHLQIQPPWLLPSLRRCLEHWLRPAPHVTSLLLQLFSK
jgi:hypothetical protein